MNISLDKDGNLVIEQSDGSRNVYEPSKTEGKKSYNKESVLEEIKDKVNSKLEESFYEHGMKFTTSIGDSEKTSHITIVGKDIHIQANNVKLN